MLKDGFTDKISNIKSMYINDEEYLVVIIGCRNGGNRIETLNVSTIEMRKDAVKRINKMLKEARK